MKRALAIVVILIALMCAAGPGLAEAFKVRGIKGLWWSGIEKYQEALPWLADHNLNFLMLCYSSFPASGQDWRSEYTPTEKQQIGDLAAKGKKRGVSVCLSFNPGIWSKPPLTYSSDQDYALALNKVKSIHALGVNWFALCLDDINRKLEDDDIAKFGTLQAAQVHFVNRLWRDMKTLNPRPKLIFCPSAYLTEDAVNHLDYINTIGEGIDKDVMMFWTGPQCCSTSISAADANVFAKWIRRKPFVWDNYPVNDMFSWRLLMSPLKNRSADLPGATSGYISNPMKQWHASTIPLATTAAYLNDPASYDPAKAMEAAIRSYPSNEQRAVRLLVELYGSSFWGEKGFPPQPKPTSAVEAEKALPKYRALRKELSSNPGLADLWEDCRACIEGDIAILERKAHGRTGSPLKARGDDFEGGAGDVFGYYKMNRAVNYIYAKPTGRDKMAVDFQLAKVPAAGATLRLVGLNGDTGVLAKVRITFNDFTVVDGETVFGAAGFETKTFELPASALKAGRNTLSICNLEEQGALGMPPWFMVSEAEIAAKEEKGQSRNAEN